MCCSAVICLAALLCAGAGILLQWCGTTPRSTFAFLLLRCCFHAVPCYCFAVLLACRCALLCCDVLCFVASAAATLVWTAVLCCGLLCSALLRCAVLCCALLCSAALCRCCCVCACAAGAALLHSCVTALLHALHFYILFSVAVCCVVLHSAAPALSLLAAVMVPLCFAVLCFYSESFRNI